MDKIINMSKTVKKKIDTHITTEPIESLEELDTIESIEKLDTIESKINKPKKK
jgi:hypothetical protein